MIRLGNLDQSLRGAYWRQISEQEKTVMEVCELTDIDLPDQGQDQVEKVYNEIVARIDTDESRLTPKIRDEIDKDLARTRTS